MTDFRCDAFPIPNYEKRPNGFLSMMIPIAREGTLKYLNEDGSIRTEYVSRETLKRSAHTFKNQPITIKRHPGLVTSRNAKQVTVGMTGRLMKLDDKGVLWLDGTVFDQDAIDEIESGNYRQVSCGYQVATADKPREDGAIEQVDRFGNHITIVARARGGSDLTLPVGDEAEEEIAPYYVDESELTPPPIEQSTKPKPQKSSRKQRKDSMQILIGKKLMRIDAEDPTTLDAVQNAINEIIDRADSAEAERNEIKVRLDAAEAQAQNVIKERDGLQARLDAAEVVEEKPEVRSDAADLKARIGLIREVAPFMAKNLNGFNEDALYDLDPQQIKTAYLAVKRPDLKERLDSASADYVEALYDASKPAPDSASGASRVDDILTRLAPVNQDPADVPLNQDAAAMKMADLKKKRADRIAANGKKTYGAC